MAQDQNPERLARIAQYEEHKEELWNRIVGRLQPDERWDSKSLGYEMTTNDHDLIFRCPQTCMTCVGWKANGQNCTRSTCKMIPVCHSHALSYFNVAVKDTRSIAGLGLYAKRRRRQTPRDLPLFMPNDIVAPYISEKMNHATLDARYPGDITASYAWEDLNVDEPRPVFDGACIRGLGAFANSADGRQVQHGPMARFPGVNANIIYSHHLDWPVIVAIQPIFDGQEIVVSYGEDYRYNDARHSTRKRRFPSIELQYPYEIGQGFPNFNGQDFPLAGQQNFRARKTKRRRCSTKTEKRKTKRRS